MAAPSGMVAVLTRSDGHVVAAAADFGRKTPGYGTVEDAQRDRAREALAVEMMRQTCTPDICSVVIGQGYAERLLDHLCASKGYRVTIIGAGGEPP